MEPVADEPRLSGAVRVPVGHVQLGPALRPVPDGDVRRVVAPGGLAKRHPDDTFRSLAQCGAVVFHRFPEQCVIYLARREHFICQLD